MTDLFDLSGHAALITGGNGGIGLAMADALARSGADVAVWGTNEDKNRRAVEQLVAHGNEVAAFRCDVSDEAQVEAAFAGTLEALGRVDSCFANAGVSGGGIAFVETTMEEWRRVLDVNLDGVFLTLRAAARHMVERGGGGSLVGVSSLAAIEGQPRGEHYSASKAGLIGIMRSLAVELARHGIRANSLLPGWVETDMTSGLFSWDRFAGNVIPRIPVRRWGQPEDFGAAAVYLANPAFGYHTGDTILIDGGYSIF